MEGPKGREASSKTESDAEDPKGNDYMGSETSDKPAPI